MTWAADGAWAVRLPVADAAAAAELRCDAGVTACLDGAWLWLRGTGGGPVLGDRLTRLPGAERYRVEPTGNAIPLGCVLPATTLPTTGWTPVREHFRLQAPSPAMPGAQPDRIDLELVDCGQESPVAALRCAWGAWLAWAATAPRHRLDRLRFARAGREALVLGDPLPPLPGVRLWRCGPCLLPAGRGFALVAEPGLLARVFGVSTGDLVVVDQDGTWSVVPAAAVAPAQRNLVRSTADPGDG